MYVITVQPKKEFKTNPLVFEIRVYSKDVDFTQPCVGTDTYVCLELPEYLIKVRGADSSVKADEQYYCESHVAEALLEILVLEPLEILALEPFYRTGTLKEAE